MGNFVDHTPGEIDLANDNLLASPSVRVSGSEFNPERFKLSSKEKRWKTIQKRKFKQGVGVKMVDGTQTIISTIFSNGEIGVKAYPGKRINPLSLKLL
ncbi:MAG: hypothetical protein R6V40_00010 [Candidatus Moraniibacteriota bacterium]